MSFNRIFRHAFDSENEDWQGATRHYEMANPTTGNGGWRVLPIQNAVQAAMRPRDWVALNNYFCKWRIKSVKVECSNFNCEELRPDEKGAIQATTIPNLYFECYVDSDHLLPGYEQDFSIYATNNGYSTGDCTSSENRGDVDLKSWLWMNTIRDTFLPDRELNLCNGPGYKFIKMTDNFDFTWEIPEKERHWRHAGQPWQYQLNPTAVLQSQTTRNLALSRDPGRDKSRPWQGNLTWGGFPGGMTGPFGWEAAFGEEGGGGGGSYAVEWHRQAPVSGSNNCDFEFEWTGANPGNYNASLSGGTGTGATRNWKCYDGTTGEIWPTSINLKKSQPGGSEHYQSNIYGTGVRGIVNTEGEDQHYGATEQGVGGPQSGWALHNADKSDYVWYQAGGLTQGYETVKGVGPDSNVHYAGWKDQTARNQITGVPQMNTPPPLILFKTNNRRNQCQTDWQFWCKYSVVIEGHRNTMGFFPMEMNGTATSSWTGCGNLGFTTAPGLGNYNNMYDDAPWTQAQYDYPYDDVAQPAQQWVDQARPQWGTVADEDAWSNYEGE
jgi:hypothetical protein